MSQKHGLVESWSWVVVTENRDPNHEEGLPSQARSLPGNWLSNSRLVSSPDFHLFDPLAVSNLIDLSSAEWASLIPLN